MSLSVFSSETNRAVLTAREYAKTTSGTPDTAARMRPDNVVATSVTASGTTATFTASAAHRLADGQYVTIAGAVQPQYNGRFKITVTSATVFTYTMVSAPTVTTATTGTSITAKYVPYAKWMWVTADSENEAAITIGPDINADWKSLAAGDETFFEVKGEDLFDIGRWYAKSASASQAYTVLFV